MVETQSTSAIHLAYKNKKVLVTGHTGFKGSWLCEWLLMLGADVTGYARDPLPHEVLFQQLGLSRRMTDHRGDIADRDALVSLVRELRPEVVFHLAAQPLVRLSYDIPVETFATNIMGTAHLLDAVRQSGHPCAVVAITTDKCYENQEWLHAYREEDPMGGYDPYSASKGAAELLIASYRRSFFHPNGPIKVASARAGNVIGGGDWALDRIVPDCIRAVQRGEPIPVRNKIATRPWQHVLEPLSGYLWLGACLATRETGRDALCSAFNFGPPITSNRTVADLVNELVKHTGGKWLDATDPNARHEASYLNLATDKAFHLLGWRSVWSFEETIAHTAEWYLNEPAGGSTQEITRNQILRYNQDAAAKGLDWAS